MPLHIVGRMATSRGGAPVQLDRGLVWEGTVEGPRGHDDIRCKVYAVFDGHGSSKGGSKIAAHMCQAKLLRTLFRQHKWAHGDASTDDITSAIRSTFKELEKFVIDQTKLLDERDGCSVALLVIRGSKGWVCNVGAAHVVRYRHSRAERLSTEHTLGNDNERNWVPRWAQQNRLVMRKMPTTRSIGDRDMKKDRSVHPWGRAPVTWYPSIHVITVSDKDEFVVATRGLWRENSYRAWARMAHRSVDEKHGIRAAARDLVENAKDANHNSRHTNVTVIVVLARRDFNGRHTNADNRINGDLAKDRLAISAGIATKYHAISAYRS